MGHLRAIRTLAVGTYKDIVTRPIYTLVLLGLAFLVFSSQYITLFSFYLETNVVREMGLATLTFFGFVITVIFSGIVVTQELEDRTAITLLSKPIARGAYLLGRFGGLLLAIAPGMFILAGVLFLTLWFMALPGVYGSDVLQVAMQARGHDAWGVLWHLFVLRNGGIVLEGALLCFLQVSVLGAIAISLAAFLPVVVSVSATSLVFILGNMSSYMLAAVEKANGAVVKGAARLLYYLLPNLGYFNLQTYFSEGKIITLQYLLYAVAYAVLYVSGVFLCSCAAFERREIR